MGASGILGNLIWSTVIAGGVAEAAGAAGKGPLAKGPSPLPPTPLMPDQQLMGQAAKREAALSIGRTGRASTILSAGSDVGTSDKLGP